MAAIEWIAAVLLLTGVAGMCFVYVRYLRPLRAPDPALRDELRALGEERRRRIARAIADGSVVEDAADARLALGAYERARAWTDACGRLAVAGLPAEVAALLLAIDVGSVFLYVILGAAGSAQAVFTIGGWRRRRRGDRWAAATRAFHAR